MTSKGKNTEPDPHMAERPVGLGLEEEPPSQEEAELLAKLEAAETEEEQEAIAREYVRGQVGETIPAEDITALPELAGMELDAQTAKVIAAMQAQLRNLEGQLDRVSRAAAQGPDDGLPDTGMTGWPWQYYKRPTRKLVDGTPDPMSGWVVALPGGAGPSGRRDVGSYTNYLAKGMKAITKYGPCPVPSDNYNQPGNIMRAILERGGAKEFPVTQVLAYGWHVKPPIPGLEFPQVYEVADKILHFACRDCTFELWCLSDDDEAASVCFRHIRQNKGDGRHGYSREEANMILERLGFRSIAPHAWEAKKAELKAIQGEGAPLGLSAEELV